MKQITRWGLAVLLLLLCTIPALAFNDTGSLEPLELAAVEALNDMGIIAGYPDGTFRPDEPLTRAEFSKILCLFAPQDQLEPASSAFTDVAPGAWYAAWVARASRQGWMSGYPGGEFRPEAHISQQELATVLLRLSGRETAGLAWPGEYIDAAREEGILEGLEFSGTAKASRLLTCRMFYNMLPGQPASISADGLYLGVVKDILTVEDGTEVSFYYGEQSVLMTSSLHSQPTAGSFIYYTVKDGVIDDWHLLLDPAKDYVAASTPLTRLVVTDGPYNWVHHQSGKEVEKPAELKTVKPLVQYVSYRNLTVGKSTADSQVYWMDDDTCFFEVGADGLLQPGSRDSLQLKQPATLLVDKNGAALYVFCYIED